MTRFVSLRHFLTVARVRIDPPFRISYGSLSITMNRSLLDQRLGFSLLHRRSLLHDNVKIFLHDCIEGSLFMKTLRSRASRSRVLTLESMGL